MARPRKVQPGEHVPTEETRRYARELYMGGTTIEELGELMSINALTVVKHYAHDLQLTFHEMRGALSNNLYQRAMAGNDKSQEFWLKTRGRWSNYKPPEQIAQENAAKSLLEEIRENTKPKSGE